MEEFRVRVCLGFEVVQGGGKVLTIERVEYVIVQG